LRGKVYNLYPNIKWKLAEKGGRLNKGIFFTSKKKRGDFNLPGKGRKEGDLYCGWRDKLVMWLMRKGNRLRLAFT